MDSVNTLYRKDLVELIERSNVFDHGDDEKGRVSSLKVDVLVTAGPVGGAPGRGCESATANRMKSCLTNKSPNCSSRVHARHLDPGGPGV